MRAAAQDLAAHRGEYGFDAPYVPILMGSSGLLLLVVAAGGVALAQPFLSRSGLIGGLWMLLSTASYVYTTRAGKFAVWAHLLRQLELRGSERLLDMGCGRGAVLLMAARLLPEGKAVGVDLWKSSDQSGNTLEAAQLNAVLEGVADRVEFVTGDMAALPFENESFDVVVSSLAIHNITDSAGRLKALDEAFRVLKRGGQLMIADFRATQEYANHLRQLGMREVGHRTLDWRYWYGGPWTATKQVRATKP
jgi:ubiquinone/menaquinone biosynthesis C-methylase UbiE